jgi:hypothetical protein
MSTDVIVRIPSVPRRHPSPIWHGSSVNINKPNRANTFITYIRHTLPRGFDYHIVTLCRTQYPILVNCTFKKLPFLYGLPVPIRRSNLEMNKPFQQRNWTYPLILLKFEFDWACKFPITHAKWKLTDLWICMRMHKTEQLRTTTH